MTTNLSSLSVWGTKLSITKKQKILLAVALGYFAVLILLAFGDTARVLSGGDAGTVHRSSGYLLFAFIWNRATSIGGLFILCAILVLWFRFRIPHDTGKVEDSYELFSYATRLENQGEFAMALAEYQRIAIKYAEHPVGRDAKISYEMLMKRTGQNIPVVSPKVEVSGDPLISPISTPEPSIATKNQQKNIVPVGIERNTSKWQRKPLHRGWSCLIVFIASVVAAIIIKTIGGVTFEVSLPYFAEILGGALVYFVLGAILAVSIRGGAGVVAGVAVIALFGYFAGSEVYREQKPQREALNSALNLSGKINSVARTSFENTGHMNVDPALIRALLSDLASNSKNLDTNTPGAVEAIVEVMTLMLERAEASQNLMHEIATVEFLNARNDYTIADIDNRLTRLGEFRNAANNLVLFLPDLDLRLKTALARRNLTPLAIKTITDTFMRAAQIENTTQLARSNVDFADAHLRRFEILKEQWGHWRVQNSTVYFEDSNALGEWNILVRRLFEISEQRAQLEKQVVAKRPST